MGTGTETGKSKGSVEIGIAVDAQAFIQACKTNNCDFEIAAITKGAAAQKLNAMLQAFNKEKNEAAREKYLEQLVKENKIIDIGGGQYVKLNNVATENKENLIPVDILFKPFEIKTKAQAEKIYGKNYSFEDKKDGAWLIKDAKGNDLYTRKVEGNTIKLSATGSGGESKFGIMLQNLYNEERHKRGLAIKSGEEEIAETDRMPFVNLTNIQPDTTESQQRLIEAAKKYFGDVYVNGVQYVKDGAKIEVAFDADTSKRPISTEAQQQIAEKDNEITKLEEELKKLRNENQQLSSNNNGLTIANLDHKKDKNKMKTDHQEAITTQKKKHDNERQKELTLRKNMEEQVLSTAQKNRALLNENEELIKSAREAKKQLGEQTSEIDELKGELNTAEKTLGTKDTEIKKLDKATEELKTVKDEAENNLTKAQEKINTLTNELGTAKDEIETKDAEIKELKDENKSAIDELEKELEDMQAAVAVAATNLKTSEGKLKISKTKETQAEGSIKVISSKLSQAEELLRAQDTEINGLRQKLGEFKNNSEDIYNDNINLTEEITKLKNENTLDKQQLKGFEKLLMKKADDLAKLQNKIDELKVNNAGLKAESKEQKEVVETQKSNIEKLQTELENALTTIKEQQETINPHNAEVKNKDRKIEEQQIEIDEQKEDISSITYEIENYKTKSNAISKELQQVKDELESLKTNYQKTTEELEEKQQQLKEQEKRYQKQSQDSEATETANAQLQLQNSQLQKNLQKLIEGNNKLKKSTNNDKQKISELESQSKKLTELLANEKTKTEQAQEKTVDVTKVMGELSNSKESLKKQLASTERDLSNSNKTNTYLTEQLKDSNTENDSLTEKLDRYSERAGLNEAEMLSNLDSLKAAKAEMKQLQEKVDKLTNENGNLKQKVEDENATASDAAKTTISDLNDEIDNKDRIIERLNKTLGIQNLEQDRAKKSRADVEVKLAQSERVRALILLDSVKHMLENYSHTWFSEGSTLSGLDEHKNELVSALTDSKFENDKDIMARRKVIFNIIAKNKSYLTSKHADIIAQINAHINNKKDPSTVNPQARSPLLETDMTTTSKADEQQIKAMIKALNTMEESLASQAAESSKLLERKDKQISDLENKINVWQKAIEELKNAIPERDKKIQLLTSRVAELEVSALDSSAGNQHELEGLNRLIEKLTDQNKLNKKTIGALEGENKQQKKDTRGWYAEAERRQSKIDVLQDKLKALRTSIVKSKKVPPEFAAQIKALQAKLDALTKKTDPSAKAGSSRPSSLQGKEDQATNLEYVQIIDEKDAIITELLKKHNDPAFVLAKKTDKQSLMKVHTALFKYRNKLVQAKSAAKHLHNSDILEQFNISVDILDLAKCLYEKNTDMISIQANIGKAVAFAARTYKSLNPQTKPSELIPKFFAEFDSNSKLNVNERTFIEGVISNPKEYIMDSKSKATYRSDKKGGEANHKGSSTFKKS